MPQMKTITLTKRTDGSNVSFAPNAVDKGVTSFVSSSGVPIGDARITSSITANQNGRRRVTLKLTVPVVQDQIVNGVSRPTVVRVAYADVTLNFDGTSNEDERRNVAGYLEQMFSGSQETLSPVITKLENLF